MQQHTGRCALAWLLLRIGFRGSSQPPRIVVFSVDRFPKLLMPTQKSIRSASKNLLSSSHAPASSAWIEINLWHVVLSKQNSFSAIRYGELKSARVKSIHIQFLPVLMPFLFGCFERSAHLCDVAVFAHR